MRGGNSQTRPLVVVVKQALALYKGYLQEFGLSPSSRGKVHAEPQKPAEVDPMLALLDGD
jgi:hypothetical protein